jgi:hypothetical protein
MARRVNGACMSNRAQTRCNPKGRGVRYKGEQSAQQTSSCNARAAAAAAPAPSSPVAGFSGVGMGAPSPTSPDPNNGFWMKSQSKSWSHQLTEYMSTSASKPGASYGVMPMSKGKLKDMSSGECGCMVLSGRRSRKVCVVRRPSGCDVASEVHGFAHNILTC